MNISPSDAKPDWAQMLSDAVEKPGIISEAYRRFWNYSVGNQLLAMFQCIQRGIELGPLNTLPGWERCGRKVKRGEKALTLCLPVQVTKLFSDCAPNEVANSDGADHLPKTITVTRFVYKRRWFVLSQTEGKEYVPPVLPDWNENLALAMLMIERVSFDALNGNVQGFARDRCISVSPIAFAPHRTLFHELGHVVLGHTTELNGFTDGDEATPKDIREVEAECVSLICCQSLGLGAEEFSRGYIQHWLNGNKINERSVQKIFKAADIILKAGVAIERPAHG